MNSIQNFKSLIIITHIPIILFGIFLIILVSDLSDECIDFSMMCTCVYLRVN